VSQASIEELSHKLGLDQGVVPRYFTWLGNFLTGDWGTSIAQGNALARWRPR
jgi:peptide/nickel transport system permease protein